jgi:hypothetical protein
MRATRKDPTPSIVDIAGNSFSTSTFVMRASRDQITIDVVATAR